VRSSSPDQPTAPKINLLKSSRIRGPGGAPLQSVPGVRSALAGCRAVRDSTLVAWYFSVMAVCEFERIGSFETAKALGLDVPSMLLARADEVIE
jgi:hypothetical protein